MTAPATRIVVLMAPVLKELVRLRADLEGTTEAELVRKAVALYVGMTPDKAKTLAKGSRGRGVLAVRDPTRPTKKL